MTELLASAKPVTPPLRRLERKRRGWIVWLALFAVAAGGGVYWQATREVPAIPITAATVERGSVRDFVTSVAAGRVAGKQEAAIRADFAGKVLVLHHRRGDVVAAGEPLVTYDPAELEDRVRVAESAVLVARAQLRQAQQGSANMETNLVRTRRLAASGALGTAQLDDLEGQAKTLARTVEAARAAIAQAAANVELSRTALTRAVVRAPFAGTVLATRVEVGETTAPGAPLVDFADVSTLHVDAEVDEADLGRLRVGLAADISLDAFPGERIRGQLADIAPSVARDPRGGRSVAVEVALPADARLRVGMSADVDVIVAVQESALFVPPNAVLGRGAERSVFVVDKGIAHKRPVEVGISTWEAVEIRSGVAEGDAVVASLSSGAVTDGAAVTLRNGDGP
jgi:RND family efflux transporter MFP subunit